MPSSVDFIPRRLYLFSLCILLQWNSLQNLLLLERDLIYKAGFYLLYRKERKVVHGMLPFWEREKLPGSFFEVLFLWVYLTVWNISLSCLKKRPSYLDKETNQPMWLPWQIWRDSLLPQVSWMLVFQEALIPGAIRRLCIWARFFFSMLLAPCQAFHFFFSFTIYVGLGPCSTYDSVGTASKAPLSVLFPGYVDILIELSFKFSILSFQVRTVKSKDPISKSQKRR